MRPLILLGLLGLLSLPLLQFVPPAHEVPRSGSGYEKLISSTGSGSRTSIIDSLEGVVYLEVLSEDGVSFGVFYTPDVPSFNLFPLVTRRYQYQCP